MIMKKNLTLTASLFIFGGMVTALMATPLPPGPTVIPIDGGISLLLAGCVGVGAKMIYDYRKSKKAEN